MHHLKVRSHSVPDSTMDWHRVRLPRPLYFLYYLVRPMRFVVERLAVAARPSR